MSASVIAALSSIMSRRLTAVVQICENSEPTDCQAAGTETTISDQHAQACLPER